MNNKKTPADFASTPAHKAVHAIVATVAIVGIANSMVIPSKAVSQDSASYDTAAQKLNQNDIQNGYTYGNIQTSSRQGYGSYTYIGNDDNNSYTDNN